MAHNLSLGVAVFVTVISLVKLLEALYATRLVPAFPGFPKEEFAEELPTLSVIVPARNEETELESSLDSLLEQDYPNLEIILVNDRSTDGTGGILDRVAGSRQNARVLHVEHLPGGWIGKNHAIYSGERWTNGEWLLLTDADVRFRPDTLRRAVTYAEQHGLDHLTLVPRWELPGYWLKGVVAFFYVVLLLYEGYYRANMPRRKKGIGVGAFNLIRHKSYREIGGYEAFPRRPDDDLTLGSRVKESGLRQRVLLGHRLISVKWYGSLGALARGFEKNAYAALDYSLPKAVLYSASLLLVSVWPFVAISFSTGYALPLYLVAIGCQLGAYAISNHFLGWRLIPLTVGYPVFATIFTGLLIRSTLLALLRGGVYWRGTFYPNSLLRNEESRPNKKSFS